MATTQDSKEAVTATGADTPPSLEKGTGARRHSVGDGFVPENLREADFRTRNGLNLKSFQRRTYPPHLHSDLALTEQVIGVPRNPSSIVR